MSINMNTSSRVTVNSTLTAVSSKPTTPGKTHPLSVLDHAMGLHTLHIIFYYRQKPFGFFDLDPLRESLSTVLSVYPPVTGRLTRGEQGNWEVKCNDAGVRILRATVGTTLDEWLRSADWSEERDLTLWEDMPHEPDTWSLFRVQINEFEGGGAAIGLSCSHMNGDPISLTKFMKSWADIHNKQSLSHPPAFFNPSPIHGRKTPNTCTKSANFLSNKSKARTPNPVKMSSATFKFSSSTIKKCLDNVRRNAAETTPFDFLAALFWKRIALIKGPQIDHKFHLLICTDFRKQLRKTIPDGYFGNALHFSHIAVNANEMSYSGLENVVNLLHENISSLEDDDEIFSVLDWLESRKEDGGKFSEPFNMYGSELTCINMEHMILEGHKSLMYEAMFGSGVEPLHVSYQVSNSEGEGLILVMPSPENGVARMVTVLLPEPELLELSEDEAILSLEPTMLLNKGQ